MDNMLAFLTTIAGIVEGITLDQALRLVEASNDYREVTVPPLSTPEGLRQAARESDVVVDYIKSNQKIQAIKNLRVLAHDKGVPVGLREAKDAIDFIWNEYTTYSWAERPAHY